MTKEEEDKILAQAKEIEQRRNKAYFDKAEIVKRRVTNLWNGHEGQRFAADELTFAARSRCKCGLGLAYPNDTGMHGSWDCSGVLLGAAAKDQPHDSLPFAFYEIKSENQPSANGATTRAAPTAEVTP